MYFGMKRTLLLIIYFCLLLSTAWCNIAEIKWKKEQLRNWRGQEILSNINLDDLGSEEEQKCGNFNLEEERTCGDYRVTIYKDKDDIEMLLKILKKNKVVYSERGHHFRIGLIYDDMPEDKLVRSCKDITRNGKPNLVVSEWSGGAHCCFTFRVFSLGKNFRQITLIDGGDGDYSKFVDVDRDGALEFVGRDWTYAYWNTCFAWSPAPEVILKYRNDTYRLAMDLMKKPPPTPSEEEKIIKEIDAQRKDLQEDFAREKDAGPLNIAWVKDEVLIPPLVWAHMLDLIYTSQAQDVGGFLDKIWPIGGRYKEAFLLEFKDKLMDSPYCFSLNEFYGERFPISCNPNPPDFGESGLKELFKRDHFK